MEDKIDDVSKRIKENTEKIQLWREEIKNDGKPAIKETPNVERLNKETENRSEPSIEAIIENDETMEELSLQSEDNAKQTENKEDSKALLSENKHNRDKENIQHIEINTKREKNQIIPKTKKIGKICPNKKRNTREGMEMIKDGLVNIFNLPINEQRELIKFKNYRQNLIKILKVNHNKMVNKNLNKDIFKLNLPAIEMHHTMLIILSISNVSLKYLVNNPNDEMIKIVLNTSDYFMLEELQYLLIKKELTTTEVVQTGMEAREVNEDLVAAKWKSLMISRYFTSTETNLDTKIIRGNRATRIIDHG